MIYTNFPVSKTVLLTGAGFTHNFGGFLARRIWGLVHNNLQRSGQSRLTKKLKQEFNYEELYQQIIYGTDYTADEKSAFIDAVLSAYDALDGVIRDYYSRYTTRPMNLNHLSELISRISGQGDERGFFFTLNQDLFIERYYCPGRRLVIPGGRNDPRFVNRNKPLEPGDFVLVPTEKELERHKNDLKNLGDLCYIKLHGSYDFRDRDNKRKLIIGTSKEEQIKNEPLLLWYFKLFEEVLSLPQRRLLIIGYGFRDPHINKIIAMSVLQNGLRIFIVSPIDPEVFKKDTLRGFKNRKDKIWEAVAGYYNILLEFFPQYGASPTEIYKIFAAEFFED